ncbi:putative Hybrid PKS-NRPS biosynthetic cluster [Claviceps maximensis]|nr:putative Hybrid PKS-NRPS biosynthetic cluster [Claviceps maximensis]
MVRVETPPLHSCAEPIAIIGSGCRLPGPSNSPSALWKFLRQPHDVLKEIPRTRFDSRGFYHEDSQFPGHTNVKHSYFLDGNIAHFDASFFSITPAEAMAMDPQQRLLLETVFEAMEGAGLTIEGLKGSDTGVFLGQMFVDYEALQFRDLQTMPTYVGLGTARSIASNRVSYFFDWHGPSVTIDTACSSSLVAVHQAVQALRAKEVQVAVVAGTNLLLGPESYIYESSLHMLSPEGRSRMWDESANGYARGDGIAAIMLKPLSAAMADGDRIECIIRETGVNQDGRSLGIAMPSAEAQSALIRATYRRAGLDPTRASDRCQYFEAHGTGTPAGDPIEAEAVHRSFFGDKERPEPSEPKLLVGSIKTIIGHTESTAGIAGILKVSQALQHGQIPPNLWFNNLNPKILPFYHHLHIPKELMPWPDLPAGSRRRASVNSFGFGGTNAHVILESFESSELTASKNYSTRTYQQPVIPFVFSAQSKPSLLASLDAYAAFLNEHPEVSLSDLAWSLQKRRSRFQLRLFFSSSSREDLIAQLRGAKDNLLQIASPIGRSGNSRKSRILGIFTGQGGQWARMGAELIENCPLASDILTDLDNFLKKLPESDRPTWTLRQEILAHESCSKIRQAALSQPALTAIQIILTEVLRRAGIEFSAVVGFSSGEIAAAFAAGYLSSYDALQIAYYRGFHAHRAGGTNGSTGAMLVVGTSLEDAEELCVDEHFAGRVNVAACNSPSSVTVSGDEDAITAMADIFEDEGKFVRRLRLDTAYHSHHMKPCSEPYLRSISNVSIAYPGPTSACPWFSSVYPDRKPEDMALLDPSYWVENLLLPVLFMQAFKKAVNSGSFDAVIEVGPHPVLKEPVRETTQSVQVQIPYTGTLERQHDSIHSISNALGYIWAHVDNASVDFEAYEQSFGKGQQHRLPPDLPLYQWNHNQEHWHESSLSLNLRQRSQLVHPLLGDLESDNSPHRLSWRHTVRPKDLPWIHGHRIQGQTIWPAAAMIVTAFETASFLISSANQEVQLIELEDFRIHQAMVFANDDQDTGIQTRVTTSSIDRSDSLCIRTHFTYESRTDSAIAFHLVAEGKLTIHLGQPSKRILPASRSSDSDFVHVTRDILYSYFQELGYEYEGPFNALSNLRRKLGKVSGSVETTALESYGKPLIVHPGTLDAAFQSLLLALSYPRDGQLWTLHLPRHIRRIRANPLLCGSELLATRQVKFETSMDVRSRGKQDGWYGEIEIHSHDGEDCAIQAEGLHLAPFTPASPADDREIFYGMRWIDAEPNAAVSGACKPTEQEKRLSEVLERASFFYLGRLESQIDADCPGRADKYFAAYINFARHTLQECKAGKHRYAKLEWLEDTEDDIIQMCQQFSGRPEIKAMFSVGRHMHRAIRGETTMLEHFMMNGILEDYYTTALSISQMTPILADSVMQIVSRYPTAKILEVGAGTGGATRQILDRIGDKFASYTFTDVSADFLNSAQTKFISDQNKIQYRVLDLDEDIKPQGFEEGAFDVVVASLVIHATKRLEQTLRRIRYLLKPGGYLISCEVTNEDVIRINSLFGCLPGWWQGIEEGRTNSAAVSVSQWHSLLQRAGFSGIDSISSVEDTMTFPTSVFTSQAVNEMVKFVREPLKYGPPVSLKHSTVKRLFIVGGTTLPVSRLIQRAKTLIQPFCNDIVLEQSLETFSVNHTSVPADSTVVILEDLDHHVFENLTTARLDSLKKLFGSEKSILWVTRDRRTDNAYASMSIGFARSALWEIPDLRLQFLDFEDTPQLIPEVFVEYVLRFHILTSKSNPNKSPRDVLFSIETEIIVAKDQRSKIQRMEPLQSANDRYNSAHRLIEKHVSPSKSPVALIKKRDSGYMIQEVSLPPRVSQGDEVHLLVSHSLLRAVRTCAGDMFIVLGRCTRTGVQYITSANSVSSLMVVHRGRLHQCPSVSSDTAEDLLKALSARIAVKTLSEGMGNSSKLLVHNAHPNVAAHIQDSIRSLGLSVAFTTASRSDAEKYKWTYISPYSRSSVVKAMVPFGTSVWADWTLSETPSGLSSLRSSLHESAVKLIDIESIFPVEISSKLSFAGDVTSAHRILQNELDALSSSTFQDVCSITGPKSVSIAHIAQEDVLLDALTVVDWSVEAVKVEIQPVQTVLRPDRTYWLAGLSKSMGCSLADWMIDSGASNLVISSRSPQLDQHWLDETARRGAVVRVMSGDVTNIESLQVTYNEIKATMPPLAGVAQGAMVLRDMPVRDMTLDDLSQVLRPKVEGSLNLDSLLRNESLDFFVFFSSLSTIAGNMGQASYTAANLFMTGLAQQRRHRGAAASVINLGPVLGIGIITREMAHDTSVVLHNRGLLSISETDVHQIFAEAIRSSHPASNDGEWQISTAIKKLPESAENRPSWYNYPQFACLTLPEAAIEVDSHGQQATISIKDQLADATSRDEVEKVITESFIRELRKILRLGDDAEIVTSVRTDELGLDSLIAVRIRSWFLKNFQVNIPALRILMGPPLQELIIQALKGIPAELVPKVSPDQCQISGSDELDTQETLSSSSLKNDDSTSGSPGSPHTAKNQTESAVNPKSDASSSPDSISQDHHAEIQRVGRASFTQAAFLFVHKLLENKSTLNNVGILHFKGGIRVSQLSRAIKAVSERHEALRTCIRNLDGRPSQIVLRTSLLQLEAKKVSTDEDISAEYAALRRHAFDLDRGQTSRIVLLSKSPHDHYLIVAFHHIIFDRTSVSVFFGDMDKIYRGVPVMPAPVQYLDISNAQYEEYEAGHWKQRLNFWRSEYRTIPEVLPLCRSQVVARQTLEQYTSHVVTCRIGRHVSDGLEQLAKVCKSTTFHVCLAAVSALLRRFLGSRDFCICIVDRCRSDDDHSATGIGPFINMLPLRMTATSHNQKVDESIVEARNKAFSVLENALPLELILNELQVVRKATHTPLAQVLLNYSGENSAQDEETLLGCEIVDAKEHQAELPYDMAFTVVNNPKNGIRFILNVQSSLYTARDAQLIADGFEDILTEFAQDPHRPIGDEWRFRQDALKGATDIGRGDTLDGTWPETVVHRFEDIASSFGMREAVADDDGNSLTYEDLSTRIDDLSWRMLQNHVVPGDRVAVFQDATVYWVVSVMAIMKIGAIYVPLEASTPLARLAMMSKNCDPAAVVVNDGTLDRAKEFDFFENIPIINVSNMSEAKKHDITIPILARPEATAMMLHTSGSSGQPKAVMLQHMALVHEMEQCPSMYKLDHRDVVLQQSAWSFDLSITQLFMALCTGAKLQVVCYMMRPDPDAIVRTITQCGVTATYATPTEYRSWLSRDSQMVLGTISWKLALVAGEPVTRDLLQLFRGVKRPDLRLFNVYGPTETTCGSTKMELPYQDERADLGRWTPIPVGRPSKNESLYILDSNQNLQPIGQVGEIYIGGVGVAQGYFNDTKRTEAAFISNPFATQEDMKRGWTSMYRTGDLGYLNDEGILFLKGRIAGDTEIKLNGVRVNLVEIEETVLLSAKGALSEAVACLRSSSNVSGSPQFVVVYVVFSRSHESVSDRASFLQSVLENSSLPVQTRPSAIIPIDEIPRLASGKVDRKMVTALPLALGSLESVHHTVLSDQELSLRGMWQKVIPNDLALLRQIDADTDFFSAGGSSLLLIELQSHINNVLGTYIPLLELFQASTLGSMARLLSSMERSEELQNEECIDWYDETKLPDDLVQRLDSSKGLQEVVVPFVPPRVVILTGATGYLGRYLVQRLVDEDSICKIICIAIRNRPCGKSDSLMGNPKVEFYDGDLRLPRLGLEQDTASRIFRLADVVIHNGAEVSHLKTYQSLRQANVASTQELIKLCLPRKLPLHYISTSGVSMYTSSATMAEASVRDCPPPKDGHYGYVASKWASEVFLENVHREHGLSIGIHRPSSILRPQSSLEGDNPVEDFTQNLLLYSRRMSAVPAMILQVDGTLDLVYPETVSRKVIEAVMETEQESHAGRITYTHETGDRELLFKDVGKPVEVGKETAGDVEKISLDEWTARAQEMGLSDSMAVVFRGMESFKNFNFPRLLRRNSSGPV